MTEVSIVAHNFRSICYKFLYTAKAYVVYIIYNYEQRRQVCTSWLKLQMDIKMIVIQEKGYTVLSHARPLLWAVDWLLSSLPIDCLLFYNEESETVRSMDIQRRERIRVVEFCFMLPNECSVSLALPVQHHFTEKAWLTKSISHETGGDARGKDIYKTVLYRTNDT